LAVQASVLLSNVLFDACLPLKLSHEYLSL